MFCLPVLSHCLAEISPVCAIVGGIVGQEVVKVGVLYCGLVITSYLFIKKELETWWLTG